jgi:plasmid stabilization system protein ParE
MALRKIEFHPDAVMEASAARLWYARRAADTGVDFMMELEHALEMIIDAPERWPAHMHGTRRRLLRRFPYLVIYRVHDDVVQVIAVAHGRRRPGFWKDRLEE